MNMPFYITPLLLTAAPALLMGLALAETARGLRHYQKQQPLEGVLATTKFRGQYLNTVGIVWTALVLFVAMMWLAKSLAVVWSGQVTEVYLDAYRQSGGYLFAVLMVFLYLPRLFNTR